MRDAVRIAGLNAPAGLVREAEARSLKPRASSAFIGMLAVIVNYCVCDIRIWIVEELRVLPFGISPIVYCRVLYHRHNPLSHLQVELKAMSMIS